MVLGFYFDNSMSRVMKFSSAYVWEWRSHPAPPLLWFWAAWPTADPTGMSADAPSGSEICTAA